MATRDPDATAAALVIGGVLALGVSFTAIVIAIALSADEPTMAKPWWIGGLLVGAVA